MLISERRFRLKRSSIARDVGVKRPTVENYFSILEDTLLAYRLYPFEAGIRVKERTHPKFYWIDAGIVRALREDWGAIHPHDKGPLFEGFVLLLLRAYQSYTDAFDQISYWSTPHCEVDFLIKKDSKYYAIKVKSGTRFRQEDTIGLKAIVDLPRLKRRLLVYPEMEAQKTVDGIEIIGLKDLEQMLEQRTLF